MPSVFRCLIAVLLGCGSSSKPVTAPVSNTVAPVASPGPMDPKERHFQRMEQFVDAMCACKDAACVEQVQADINTWNREHERPAMEDADLDRAMELARKMVGCVAGPPNQRF